MKLKDREKLKKARNMINLLVEGINPLTNEALDEESFINDPKMIRLFSYLSMIITADLQELDETTMDQQGLFKETSNSSTDANDDYKSINERINSSKLRKFHNRQLDELKRLADYMDKEGTV